MSKDPRHSLDLDLDEIFYEALKRAEGDRARYLSEACGDRDSLRSEVDSLLAAHEGARDFLETPAYESSGGEGGGAATDIEPGQLVGAYRIERIVGTGGMSTVYLAERADGEFSMKVTVKVIKPGMDTAEILIRFRVERQVLANLQHRNIGRLLDGGATETGRPYLVMEYIDGDPIDRYCSAHQISIPDRLRLFRDVCGAVQYAHRHLVIHRDLKPSNILVSRDGEVKLLDFGIAKVLRADPFDAGAGATATRTGIRAMTPRYASPEQVRHENVTTATDVYSLGVILYELLTGHAPYVVEGSTPVELDRIICDTEPTKPSERVTQAESGADTRRHARELEGDLDNIVLMALRKEPDRRYESAEQLSEDIRRHLGGLPVIARPDTVRYRTTKFLKRNRGPVAAIAALFFVLLAATTVSTALFVQASRSRDVAQEAQKRSESERQRAEEISRFLQEMLASVDPDHARGRDTELLRELLDQASARLDRELGDRSDLTWSLHQTIGSTYLALGSTEEAEHHQRRALATLQNESSSAGAGIDLRKNHVQELASAYARLSEVVGRAGRYAEAESLAVVALELPLGTSLEDQSVRAELINSLALSLDALGRGDESERRYREALAIRRETLGPRHWELAQALSNLGRFLTLHDKRAEAGPLLIESVEMMQLYAEEHPLLFAGIVNNLGEWYRWEGRYEEAEPLYRKALAVYDEILQEEHPMSLIAMGNYASLLEFQEKYDEAEPLHRKSLEMKRLTLGNEHRNVGTAANNLAGLLRKVGRYEESDALFDEATRIYERALGENHAWVAIVKANHARLFELMERGTDAERTAREALAIGGNYWEEDHIRMATATSVLGGALTLQGRFDEAEPLLLESLEWIEAQLDDEDDAVEEARSRIDRWVQSRENASG